MRQLNYTMAISRLKLRMGISDHQDYMSLRARADEARIDLNLCDAKIAQHQKQNVPGFGGSGSVSSGQFKSEQAQIV